MFSIGRIAEQFLLSGAATMTRTGGQGLIAATVSKNWIGLSRVHERRAMGIESSGGGEKGVNRALIGADRRRSRVFETMVRRLKTEGRTMIVARATA